MKLLNVQPFFDFVIKTGKTRFALSCLALLVIAFIARYTSAVWYAYASVVVITVTFIVFRSFKKYRNS